MSKPPAAPGNSDIDGVRRDATHPPDAANAAGQTAEHLKRAKDEGKGRPKTSDDPDDADDRST